MILRMTMAVEEVAAQYGSPSFAQVFTNDPVRAKVLRRRMEILKQVDRLNAEIALLETRRTQSNQELQVTQQRVEKSKQELTTIQEQVREMNTRLQNARNLLQTLAQQ
jgi:septal ring factor EnvC (AmiA/AmiB activator)